MRWEKIKILDLVDRVNNCNPTSDFQDRLFEYVDIASVDNSLKQIVNTQKILGTNAPSRARQLLKPRDVLVSTVRPNLNAVAKVPETLDGGVASTGYCVLRPIERVLNPNYLFYWVQSKTFVDDMTRQATGASYPAISDTIIKNSKIPLPPIQVQKQIANTLDKADTLRQKDQQLLRKYDELAQSIFYEMFGDPVGNSSTAVPVSSVTVINPSKKGLALDLEQDVSFVPMELVTEEGFMRTPRIRKLQEVMNGFTYFEDNDVLFAKITPCMENGKGAIAQNLTNGVGFGSTEFHVIRPTQKVTSAFIHALLRLPTVRKEAEKQMTGSAGQKRVPRSFFDSLTIELPPVERLLEFERRLGTVVKSRGKIKENCNHSDQLFNTLLSRCFL